MPTSTASDFDGNGKRVRETSNNTGTPTTTYYLHSSLLNSVVEELSNNGQKATGYVYSPTGDLIATQFGQAYVMLKQMSPTDASRYEFFVSNSSSGADIRYEFDPTGSPIPLINHSPGHGGSAGQVPDGGGGSLDSRFGTMSNPGAGCTLDGVWVPCDMANRVLSSGSAVMCADGDCGPKRWEYRSADGARMSGLTNYFQAFADGYSGFLPAGWMYTGDGVIFNSTWTGGASEKLNFNDIEEGSVLDAFAEFFVHPQRPGNRRRARRQSPKPDWGHGSVGDGIVARGRASGSSQPARDYNSLDVSANLGEGYEGGATFTRDRLNRCYFGVHGGAGLGVFPVSGSYTSGKVYAPNGTRANATIINQALTGWSVNAQGTLPTTDVVGLSGNADPVVGIIPNGPIVSVETGHGTGIPSISLNKSYSFKVPSWLMFPVQRLTKCQ